jgi:hypothetical protein
MPLLDTSNLGFLHPPRNVPLAVYESPSSPIFMSRVCDDCWEQVHGQPTPRTPDGIQSSPIAMTKCPSEASSISSSPSAVPYAPYNTFPVVPRRTLRGVQSLPHLRRPRNNSCVVPETVIEVEIPEPSYGELNTYPLRRRSAVCKATGGGRWEPKQSPPRSGYRIPGGKAPFELEMEQEEEQERLRRLNPIVRDGGLSSVKVLLAVANLGTPIRFSISLPPSSRTYHPIHQWSLPTVDLLDSRAGLSLLLYICYTTPAQSTCIPCFLCRSYSLFTSLPPPSHPFTMSFVWLLVAT